PTISSPLSLHDALPICSMIGSPFRVGSGFCFFPLAAGGVAATAGAGRSTPRGRQEKERISARNDRNRGDASCTAVFRRLPRRKSRSLTHIRKNRDSVRDDGGVAAIEGNRK